MKAQGDFTFSKDLTEQFAMGSGTYGTSCGIVGQDPELRVELEKLLDNRNLKRLEDWLETGSNVHKAYAAEGLIRLYNDEVEISAHAIEKINHLKKSRDLLSACRGCIYDTITLEEALSPYSLD